MYGAIYSQTELGRRDGGRAMLCCESRWAGYALRIDTKHVPYRIVQVQVITGNTGKPPTWINYR